MHAIIRPKQYYKGSWFLNALLAALVIVLIAVVLFPTPPHQAHRRSLCQRNLKEMAISLSTYLADYGEIPSSYLVNHSKKWKPDNFKRFNQVGKLDHSGRAETFSEALYSTMKDKDDDDAFTCPSDSSISSDDPTAASSYAWKIALDKAWYGEGCKKPCRKAADFPYPADQIVLYERKAWHSGGEGLKNRVQINVVFLDYHVKCITIKNATSGDALNCAANSDGEPMYFNYDVKTDKRLPDGKPAKWVDPQRYADRF